jgi:hypothetical protein
MEYGLQRIPVAENVASEESGWMVLYKKGRLTEQANTNINGVFL